MDAKTRRSPDAQSPRAEVDRIVPPVSAVGFNFYCAAAFLFGVSCVCALEVIFVSSAIRLLALVSTAEG